MSPRFLATTRMREIQDYAAQKTLAKEKKPGLSKKTVRRRCDRGALLASRSAGSVPGTWRDLHHYVNLLAAEAA